MNPPKMQETQWPFNVLVFPRCALKSPNRRNPIIPNGSKKVLDALNIKKDSRNLSFLDGKNVIENEIKINEIDILFEKIIK